MRGFHVGHGNRLPPSAVVGDRQHDEGNAGRPVFFKGGPQIIQRHVPLEGRHFGGIQALGTDTVQGDGPGVFDICPGGVEVDVVGHDVAGLEGHGEKHALGRPALMGGNDMLETENILDGVLEYRERFTAGVRLVAAHERGPLQIAHGTGPAVGQEVDIDSLGRDLEKVVPS